MKNCCPSVASVYCMKLCVVFVFVIGSHRIYTFHVAEDLKKDMGGL